MKVVPSLSISAALAALYASSALVVPTAATTCDEAVFGASPSTVLTEEITTINVALAGNNCTGEGLFQMPRMTWTIEPNPDDSVNTTSVFLSPSNIGTVIAEVGFSPFIETGPGEQSASFGVTNVMGIKIDRAAAANVAEIGVLIQTPKDSLQAVRVGSDGRAPSFVNIVKGFTNLRTLDLGWADTCNIVRDGDNVRYDCPSCDDLYTPEEVKGIGSSIVADLSEVNAEVFEYDDGRSTNVTFLTRPIFVSNSGFGDSSVHHMSLALPDYGEKGVPVKFHFYGAASSKIGIKGSFDCAYEWINNMGEKCLFESNPAPGCKDCSNELIIDGSINGYFNVSADSPLDIEVSDGGCNHFVPYSLDDDDRSMGKAKCSEGNVDVNVDPLPCISADIGTVECGTNPFEVSNDLCFCVAPLPDRECPSSGFSLGVVWIVSLLLPIAAALLA